jgi:hypothetical protein
MQWICPSNAGSDFLQHDDQKVKDYGVTLAVNMVRQLTEGGVGGVHFCTLNLEKSVQRVLEWLAWADDDSLHPANKLISESVSPQTLSYGTVLRLSRPVALRTKMRKQI